MISSEERHGSWTNRVDADAATIARAGQSAEGAAPRARYELDWKTPEQLLVAAMLADGSRDAAINDVTKLLFARWPDTRALAKADVAQLTQVIEPLGFAQQKPRLIAIASLISEVPVRRRAQDGERRAIPVG